MNDPTPPPNTHTPSRLSNAECLAILTSSYVVARLGDTEKRALFRAVHALARRVAQKERNARNRDGAHFAPPAVADAALANPLFEPVVTEPADNENGDETK